MGREPAKETPMPPSPALLELLGRLSRGETSVEQAARDLAAAGGISEDLGIAPNRGPAADGNSGADGETAATAHTSAEADALLGNANGAQHAISGATVDLGRRDRCGFGEVIYGEGKSPDLITEIVRSQLDAGQSALVTRIDPTIATQVRRRFEFGYHNPLAHTLRIADREVTPARPLAAEKANATIHAAVVTAGSTDAAIAEEAAETLSWMEIPYRRFEDIGVAGPQRLLGAVPALRLASAVIVIAGMEGALPAAVSGHLACPIFAVPTSVGYGANLGGLAPLLSMLNACASGVAVVNIDAGFKGGYLAGIVVGQLQRAAAAQQ
jgi:hypothetical protein